jgi:hypothetical protein
MLCDPSASGTGTEPDVKTSRALMQPLHCLTVSKARSLEFGMARVFFLPVMLGRLRNTMTFELQTKLSLHRPRAFTNHHQPATTTTTQRRAFMLGR